MYVCPVVYVLAWPDWADYGYGYNGIHVCGCGFAVAAKPIAHPYIYLTLNRVSRSPRSLANCPFTYGRRNK